MTKFSLPFLLGAALALVLTPLAARLAMRIGAIDEPGARHIHAVATPRLGGPAILLAVVLALYFTSLLDGWSGAMWWSQWPKLGVLAIGALMVMMVGAVDDVRPLRPVIKLMVETAAASMVVCGGYRIDSLGAFQLGLFAFPLSVFFLVTAANAVNLVDGLDGLAVGLCLSISATLLLLCWSGGQRETMWMLAALCGVLLGFLRYNFHPARMFLGDSGALLLGFVIGASALSISHQMSGLGATAAPFLALGLPLAEVALTASRRMSRATPIFAADCDHIHHRLLGFGFSHRKAVLLLYGVGAVFCAIALLLPRLEVVPMVALLSAVVAGCAGGLRLLGYHRELMPIRARLAPALAPIESASAVQLQINPSEP
jgi:UDP-GlcNAc:undecaprenyl-phosphate GlcNAc-1-phosphate transferase